MSESKSVRITRRLAREVSGLGFAAPVTHVYNPLDYAWKLHRDYLRRYGDGAKRAVFLGMNPGPWGMAQTGVPFGEVAAVRDWMGLREEVRRPPHEHPRRPVRGLECPRSEVSGRRLWGAFAERFGTAEAFFAEHFVTNYCPLAFMEESGRNRTPDKLPVDERDALFAVCDRALRALVECWQPRFLIGVGAFARKKAEGVCGDLAEVVQILHPSPASPAANRGWTEAATQQLTEAGVW